jgi:hypothetical protein
MLICTMSWVQWPFLDLVTRTYLAEKQIRYNLIFNGYLFIIIRYEEVKSSEDTSRRVIIPIVSYRGHFPQNK